MRKKVLNSLGASKEWARLYRSAKLIVTGIVVKQCKIDNTDRVASF